MRIAVQGVFDIGYSLGYTDSWLYKVLGEHEKGIVPIEQEGDYKTTIDKASFGFLLRGGYGLEVNIQNSSIDSKWNKEAKRLAFDFESFKDEFDDSDEVISEMRKVWNEISYISTKIIIFASGVCEIEKVMQIPELKNKTTAISILHCYEYSGYGAYYEKNNTLPDDIFNYVDDILNNSIRNKSKRKELNMLKKDILKLKKVTNRNIEKLTGFVKSFTLFVFSNDEKELIDIYNKRIKDKRDTKDDYKEFIIETDKCYISWYIELICINQNIGYKAIDSYIFYFRVFDQLINCIDLINLIMIRLNEEMVNQRYRDKFGNKISENDVRILRNYLNSLYNGIKISNITKDEEIIAIYKFITSKIDLDNTKSDSKDDLIEIDNHIDDFIDTRDKRNANMFALIGVVFSGASVISLVIEILKIINLL